MAEIEPPVLRSVLRLFATGVAVVTTWDGDTARGTTVNSFASLSLRPPLVMVALDRGRRIVAPLARSGRYAVNILGEDCRGLSDCFASGPSPVREMEAEAAEEVEMCGVSWHPGSAGLPVLDDAIASLECTIAEIHPAGDHDMYIGHVVAASARDERPQPLLYYSGRYLRIEHASVLDIEGKAEH
jgi:3-hydroxy-9,10-secoandrosta-1,3,5(10)-triene-9,17-dione monooxygenase reductase component